MDTKSSDREEKIEPKKPEEEFVPIKRRYGSQILGAMIGAFAFMVLGGLMRQLGWKLGEISNLWLWGAILGGFLGAVDSLADAGSRLTKSENRILNISVSLLGVLVIVLTFYGLSRLTGVILARLNL